MGSTPEPTAPRTKPLAQGAAPLLLAERTGDAGATANCSADRGSTSQLGSPPAQSVAAATSSETRIRAAAVRAADAPLTAGDSSTCGDGEAGGPRRSASLGGHDRDAGELYRRFTHFPVRSIRRVAYSRVIPPIVVELGRLVGLIYRSNKWVGRPRNYIHYMQDPPRLVCDASGRRLFIVGGSYRVTQRGIEG
jgi:hypothetical protein